ncbi:MAG: hypothetical protein ACTH5S_15480 [Hafnia alvei]|uniref:hypothetical protein n=1 Tax=Hafnia alvei TaxID=569 RepID=UPI003F92805A
MKVHDKNFIILALLLLLSVYSVSVFSSEIKISISGESDIVLNKDTNSLRNDFGIYINGYNVNCAGNYMVIWGHPKKINSGNPQSTSLMLFSIINDKVVNINYFSKGVFGADFVHESNYVYVNTDPEVFIDITTGKILHVSNDFDSNDGNNFESCNKNKSWYYNKYNDR